MSPARVKRQYGGSPFVRHSVRLKKEGELRRFDHRIVKLYFDLKDPDSPLRFFCFFVDLTEFVDGKRGVVNIFLDTWG